VVVMMDDERGPRRPMRENRVGVLSALALFTAATAGTLAGGHAPVGRDSDGASMAVERPVWTDGLDHVIVMTDQAYDPSATPRSVADLADLADLRGSTDEAVLDRAPVVDVAAARPEPPVVTDAVPGVLAPVAGDPALIAALEEVEGVASVDHVAAGTFAVATAGSRDDLLAVPGIAGLVDDTLYVLYDDPNQSQQWAIANTGAASQANGTPGVAGADANVVPAWAVSQGAGVVVAVLDTGVDLGHPDLAGRLWRNSDEVCANGVDDDANGYVDDCQGWDFGMNDANPSDDRGVSGSFHGTHVAGIIAAGRNGVGIVGSAPEATIMPIKATSTSSSGLSLAAVYSGIIYATDNGARVINMSFGTWPGDTRANQWMMEQAVKYATDRGVTLVAAAGNSNVDLGVSGVFPANFSLYYDSVITVGSTTNSDTRSGFSNYGSAVNVYAPGSSILSTVPGGGYGFASGTSMATPLVVGAVADLLAARIVTTPGDARRQLVSTARALTWGPRLDIAAAVGTAAARSTQVVYEGAHVIRPDTVGRVGVRVNSSVLPTGVVGARVSVATSEAGSVYAVGGLAARLTRSDGTTTDVVSAADGSLATVTLDTTTQVAPGEWRFDLDTVLPEGMYGVVTELIDASGTAIGGSYVGYLKVAPPPIVAPGPGITTTTVPTSPITSPTTTTAPIAPAPSTSLAPGSTTSVSPSPSPTTAPATTAPTSPVTAAPTTSAPAVSTTTPVNSLLPTPTTAPTSPTTSVAPSPSSTIPSPGTTAVPSPSPTTTAPAPTLPATTVPVTTAPATTAPATTTPAPAPDTDGTWRVDSMSPRFASIDGGVPLTISGRFPTSVPVYVWFGTRSVVLASNDGTTLRLDSPRVSSTGIVDVAVKFTTSRSYDLVLVDAFTFGAPSSPTTPVTTTTTTTPPVTTTPATTVVPPTTVPVAPTTVPAVPVTTSPVTTSPTSPTPTTTSPVTTSPTTPTTTSPVTTTPVTTTPVTTTPVTGSPTTTSPPISRGSLALRQPPASGSLARLATASWPTSGCSTASCSATAL
jgi:subtilisin family serine protease